MRIKAIHTIQRDPKFKPPIIYPGETAELDGDELEGVLAAGAAVAVEPETGDDAPKKRGRAKKAETEQQLDEGAAGDGQTDLDDGGDGSEQQLGEGGSGEPETDAPLV